MVRLRPGRGVYRIREDSRLNAPGLAAAVGVAMVPQMSTLKIYRMRKGQEERHEGSVLTLDDYGHEPAIGDTVSHRVLPASHFGAAMAGFGLIRVKERHWEPDGLLVICEAHEGR